MNTTSVSALPSTAGTRPSGFNLLRFPVIAALVRWSAFPALVQVLMLSIFVALAILGWGHYTPEGVNAKLYAKTNLMNLAIWGLWWPAIVWVTFLLGRAWCILGRLPSPTLGLSLPACKPPSG